LVFIQTTFVIAEQVGECLNFQIIFKRAYLDVISPKWSQYQ